MRKSILNIICFFACISLAAQQIGCGNGNAVKSNEERQRQAKFDSTISCHMHRGDYKLDSTGIVIPIVVHIVWHSDNENLSDVLILSQIDALNRDYNALNSDIEYVPEEFKQVVGNVGIHFCLAAQDPQGNPTTGILRQQTEQSEIGLSPYLFYTSQGGSDAWDLDRYLNIWVANTGKYIAGFGIYPWADTVGRSGLVVNSPYFGINGGTQYGLGRVCVHEVGHYLGLIHLWGDVFDCSVDDSVADTPPQEEPYYGCPSYPQYGCGASAMFMNFMDYVDDQCELLFTNGQKERMITALNIYRPGLLNSNVQCLERVQSNSFDVKIYPNPGSSLLNILFTPAPMGLMTYSIYNSMGEMIYSDEQLVNQELKLDLTAFSSGLYLCIVREDGEMILQHKIIKQ